MNGFDVMGMLRGLFIQTGKNDKFRDEQVGMLNQPIKEGLISFRKGAGGKKLKYIKVDRAIDAANRIFGYGQWGYKVVSRNQGVISLERKGDVLSTVNRCVYYADIELYVNGAIYPFPGDGVGIVQYETIEGHETARKDAVSDALKRALRHYGDQFGLSLYDPEDLVESEDGTLKSVAAVQEKPANAPRPALPPAKPMTAPVVDAAPSAPAQPLRAVPAQAAPVVESTAQQQELPPEREIWDRARALVRADGTRATIESVASHALGIAEPVAKKRIEQGLKYHELEKVFQFVVKQERIAAKAAPASIQQAS